VKSGGDGRALSLYRWVGRAAVRRVPAPLRVYALVGILALLPGAATPLDSRRDVMQYALDWFQQDTGLPATSVFAIHQTRDGYLWLGTRGGLARFDGVRFVLFDDRKADQLPESEVWCILEARDGGLWVGTFGGGITRIHNGRFTTYGKKDGLPDGFVRALAETPDGTLWIASQMGLTRWSGGRFETLTEKDGLPSSNVRALLVDRAGVLWIGTLGGLASWADSRLINHAAAHPEILGPRVETLAEDPRGGLWLGGWSGLIHLKDGVAARHGDPMLRVSGLAVEPQGAVWLAGGSGLRRYLDGRLERFLTRGSAPAGDTIHAGTLRGLHTLFLDREGNLWIGTNLDGLARLRDAVFTTISVGEDNEQQVASSVVFEDHVGAMWIGVSGGLVRLKDGVATVAAESHEGGVSAIAEAPDGTMWVGKESGVFKVKDGRLVDSGIRDTGSVGALAVERDGTLWIGGRASGLHRYRDGTVTRFGSNQGLMGTQVRALAFDRDGALWVGLKDGGAARWQDGAFKSYSTPQGLASESVVALHADAEGAVWIATRQGFSRWQDGRITTFTTDHGMPASFFYQIVEDDLGYIWLPYGQGIVRLSKTQLNDVAAGRRQTISAITYGSDSGIANTAMIVPNQPTAWRARDGRLWFATGRGVVVVNPRTIPRNLVVPPVHVEQARVDDVVFPARADAVFPPGLGNIEVQYTALSLVAPDRMSFRYRLEGFDAEWIESGTRRTAYYTKLPPGTYRFQVAASNNDGVWNEAGATWRFTLQPRWFQRRSVHAAAIVGGIGLAIGAYRARMREHRQRERELARRVDEAVGQVKVLRGLLPICASCKKIRDDTGYWNQMETYISTHSGADFSHSICPDCMKRLYPDYAARLS
jgi:ligand-binding sensor domain-containing protein